MHKENDSPIYTMSKPQVKAVLLCSGILVYVGIVFLFIKDAPPLVDEWWHYPQILRFVCGDFSIQQELTVFPGYHFFMAGLVRLFRNASLPFIRGVNIGMGLLAIIVFALLLKKIDQRIAWYRLLQFIFFPIILPYYFLVYTDILGLLMVMLALYLGVERKYFFSGIACCISMVIRQTNIIWVGMIFLVTYCNQERIRLTRESLLQLFRSCWLFGVGIMGMVGYAIMNGGLVSGDKQAHPIGKIYTGNVFFSLFLYGVFFLPSLIFHISQNRLFRWKAKYVMMLSLLLMFGVYLATFHNSHPYNQYPYHIRNYLLMLFTSTILYKIIFFVPIALSFCSIAATPFKHRIFLLLYPFTVCALLPSWLVEQRYYMLPFTFYLLFSKEENPLVEKITAIYYVVLSSFFIYGIGKELFFL